MDVFDRFLFDEIVESYLQPDLTTEDYEEIFQRFLNLDHVPEVKPYLLAMRFLGLGTEEDQEEVLNELRTYLGTGDVALCGLYYDLLLYKDRSDSEASKKLAEYESDGYTDNYLKEHSHLNYEDENEDEDEYEYEEDDDNYYDDDDDDEDDYESPERITIKSMEFRSNGFSGLYFTNKDVDYLSAKVYIEPVKKPCHIVVRSQIYEGEYTFSKVFKNEYDLTPGVTWFETQGWGNKNFNGYYEDLYKWIIEINGTQTYSQEFRIYNGKVNRTGPVVNNVKLFASKASGAEKADREIYKTNFEGRTLEHIYFKAFIDEPGVNMYVQFFVKVIYMEDNSVLYNDYFLHQLDSNTIACWDSIGYSSPGKWKKGLYKYTVRLGNSRTFEGTFTVY